MKFSVGKIIWKTFSKILSITFLVLFIFVLIFFFYITKKAKLDFQECGILFLSLCTFYLIFALVYQFSGLIFSWIPLLGLFFLILLEALFPFLYFHYGYQILYRIFPYLFGGTINDPNFFWSLPESINKLVGFPIQGRIIDFLFWSSFIFLVLITISQFERKVLFFLVKRKVGFALEIFEKEKAKWTEKKRKLLEAQAKARSPSAKQTILIVIFCILLVCLVVSSIFLYGKWENKKYPILWEKSFPGTAIWLEDCQQCGKKGTILSNNIKPGEPRIASFSLQEKDKEMILDVKLKAQTRIKPEFSLEIELKNPDKKTIFYISKEELFKGSLSNPEVPFSRRFNFTPDKKGEYTFKITPYSYGIFSIQVLVRDIAENK